MIPIETYYSNIIFSAEGCKGLHATLIHNEDCSDEIETCWKLSEEELKHIAQTGGYLSVHHGPLDSSGDAVCYIEG